MDAPTDPVPVTPALELAERFGACAYARPFRRYQRLALDAFEAGRGQRAGCYVVLPPGAGKTVLGLELARRLGRRTLVLCPNTAIQSGWLHGWTDFQPPTVAAGADSDLSAPLTVLTYQALCVLDDEAALNEPATRLWASVLAAASGEAVETVSLAIARQAAADTAHYRDELARYRARVRTLTARGGDRTELLALLHPNGRQIIERLAAGGEWTLVLDECHHLLQLWGYLVRAIVETLGERVFVVGLTATPPDELDPREAVLYRELFGRSDFEAPTPAVVKEGDLAPYQELVYLTTPLPIEAAYLAEAQARFQRLSLRLLDADFATLPFVTWLRRRVWDRAGKDGARVGWPRFERDYPELADAALRFAYQQQLDLPEGSRLAERHRQPLSGDDWVALIEDYCLGYLRHSTDPADEAAWQEIRHALPSLGYVLSRQGVRTYVSPVDRILALSASKAAAALAILGAERRALGDQLRALILCDYERAGSEVLARLRGVLDPQAGSAALLLRILHGDPEVAALNPVLMTGRTVACSRATAADLVLWLEEQVPDLRGVLTLDRLLATAEAGAPDAVRGSDRAGWSDLVVVTGSDARWTPRRWVPAVTAFFEAGRSRCLVGTRGLLGEGWDARRVNVLIDLTAAGTSTAVHQMRGRSLRLDPRLPEKVADNWDVVCVAPDHARGVADYLRFVRKHRHYYAPDASGEIESGVSHVHAELGPFGPPPAGTFAAINAEMLARVEARAAARARWRLGEPYDNRETETVRVRFGRTPGLPDCRLMPRVQAAGAVGQAWRRAGISGAAAVALGALGVAAFGPLGLAALLVIGAGGAVWASRPLGAALASCQPADALEDLAAAVADGLHDTGGIGAALGAASVRVVAQPDGAYRCYLAGATVAESRLFADAVDELVSPLASPRYLIPRTVVEPPRSTLGAWRVLLGRRGPLARRQRVVYHAVPAYLGANAERVRAFERAWNRWVSPGHALFYQTPAAHAILELGRGADPFQTTTQLRTLWT